jgi:outer membrane immunogenic protein
MKRVFFALASMAALMGTAAAADLPPRPAPQPYYKAPVAMQVYNWTGFYIGINGGWGWNQWSNPDGQLAAAGFNGTQNGNGGIAGGQIGFNYQISQFVVGVDADFDWANIKWSQSIGVPIAFFGVPAGALAVTVSDKDQFLSTFGARFGYAFDHALLYAKGGGAWAREQFTISALGTSATATNNRLGWMVGAGLEYAVTNNVTLKAEYNYVSFGSDNTTISNAGGTGTFNQKQNISLVKAGVSYLFNSY